jgi:putative Mn2+ efflux pump MntP
VLKLAAFVLPLGLDSFAVAAAMGTAGLTVRSRWRISLLFLIFEAGMPLIGLAAGAPLARAVGGVADYLAAAAVIGLGGWMLLSPGDDDDDTARRITATHGMGLVGLGISISLDELAIGFSLGLVRLPAVAVVIAIGVQAFVAAQLGLLLGARIGERIREGAERLAGLALIALGIFLVMERLFLHS